VVTTKSTHKNSASPPWSSIRKTLAHRLSGEALPPWIRSVSCRCDATVMSSVQPATHHRGATRCTMHRAHPGCPTTMTTQHCSTRQPAAAHHTTVLSQQCGFPLTTPVLFITRRHVRQPPHHLGNPSLHGDPRALRQTQARRQGPESALSRDRPRYPSSSSCGHCSSVHCSVSVCEGVLRLRLHTAL